MFSIDRTRTRYSPWLAVWPSTYPVSSHRELSFETASQAVPAPVITFGGVDWLTQDRAAQGEGGAHPEHPTRGVAAIAIRTLPDIVILLVITKVVHRVEGGWPVAV